MLLKVEKGIRDVICHAIHWNQHILGIGMWTTCADGHCCENWVWKILNEGKTCLLLMKVLSKIMVKVLTNYILLKFNVKYHNLAHNLQNRKKVFCIYTNFEAILESWISTTKSTQSNPTYLRSSVETWFWEILFLALMSKSVFRKTMENARKCRYINLVTTGKRKSYLVLEPNYNTKKHFPENLLAVGMNKAKQVIRSTSYRH